MYIFTNALKNLRRNKGRNMLLGLALLAIIATTLISLVISNTASAIIDDYQARFGSEVFFQFDSVMGRELEVITEPTFDHYKAFSTSEYLSHYTIIAQLWGSSPTHTAIGERDGPRGQVVGDSPVVIIPPTMSMIGVTDISTLIDFRTGSRQIIEGRMFEVAGEAVVSMDFAELNGINIGDVIEYRGMFPLPENIEVTVTGIYFDSTPAFAAEIFENWPYMSRRNEILTLFETFSSHPYMPTRDPGMGIHPSFFLRNPAYLSAFEEDVRRMGLPDYWLVMTDEDSFNAIVRPVEGLRSISITFMVIVLVLGAVILILLSGMAIRERKYEIGVLRAMGMKKSQVAHGFLFEIIAITAICLTLGIGAGTVTAQPIANVLLEQQLEALESGSQDGLGQGFFDLNARQVEEVEPLSEISLRLGIDTLAQIAIIALFLAIVASVIGIANITKYEPIKILMERN